MKRTLFSLFIWVCVRAKWISWILLLTVVWFKYKSIAFTVSPISSMLNGELIAIFYECRFYWPFLSMLSVWEECRTFGLSNNIWVMRNSFHFVGTYKYRLLLIEWWTFVECTWMLSCMLCLWLPQGPTVEVQFASIKSYSLTLFGCLFPLCFNYPFVHGFVSLYILSLSCIDHFSFYWFIPRIRLLFLRFVSGQGSELIPAV